MQTTVIKWNNSQIAENYPVDVNYREQQDKYKKNNVHKHKTTLERLVEFYGVESNKKHFLQKEIDWGKPAGNEIWK